ncbi:MAG: DNA polymerase IV [Oscillospiraceae bacterium]
MDKAILHCDLNNFFASVEIALNPDLKGLPIAVCGRTEERHGIVLAKSEEAKKFGVKTAEVVWQAKNKCKNLIILNPHFDEYIKYSNAVKEIYYRYTDLVEPFGMDECWLDVTGSQRLFGTPMSIAYDIKEAVKAELGVSVSIGVSFNKVFAKLGSDMKKPDAITQINSANFKEMIWQLPCSELLWVGKSTFKTLSKYAISTIGDIAKSDCNFLMSILGKNGRILWQIANGIDNTDVASIDYNSPIKSVGRGVTLVNDIKTNEEAKKVILSLSHEVANNLNQNGLYAFGIQLAVKNNKLISKQYQSKLILPTQSTREIASGANELFVSRYLWENPVRAITVRAIDLECDDIPEQLSLESDYSEHEKCKIIEDTMLKINHRFGKSSILEATLLKSNDNKMPTEKTNL